VQFEDVTFSAHGSTLLGPIDLDMTLTGITVVMGHNGAGKSLFLKLMHGLLIPHQGRVLWNEVEASASRDQRGFVFQSPTNMRRSVFANIAFPLKAMRWDKPACDLRVREMLDLARLTEFADQPAAVLSGGEQQRMALARALVARPKAILLDEPTSNLDPNASRMFEDIVIGEASRGTAVIMSLHNLDQAARIADHVIEIRGGRVVKTSPAPEYFQSAVQQI
jgi:tungstate transport system ATP-binding protein